MALDSLAAKFQMTANWVGTNTLTGFTNPLTSSNQAQKTQNWTTGNGASQANNMYAAMLTIAGGGNTSIDLSSFTNIVAGGAQSITKLKGVLIWLLSTADDASNGTACSGITVGNGTNPTGMFMDTASDTVTLDNGAWVAWSTPSANGKTIDGTHKTIKITNNDGSVLAKVLVVVVGA